MNNEHKIVQQVYAAKEDVQAADRLIGTYLPFIKTETAKFLKRPPIEGHDDELSIAMIAFHEAIGGYSRTRGAFLKYAAMLIRSRLIDYSRREQRHSRVISLDAPAKIRLWGRCWWVKGIHTKKQRHGTRPVQRSRSWRGR